MTTTTPDLGRHVQAFFADYLVAQRGMSPHTVLSYRDAMKLFLGFAANHHKKAVTDLGFEDLGAETVLAFLDHLEKRRGCSVCTRNTRLATIHTFFQYVAAREPQVLEICQRVAAIPTKRTPIRRPRGLEHEEVVHILRTIDRSAPLGWRDYLLVHLLFETGMRASEIAGLRTGALRLERPYQIRVLGKRRKERIVPIWPSTASLVRDYLRAQELTVQQDAPLFLGRHGGPLTRIGVLRLVKRRVLAAAATRPPLAARGITPHTFRHGAATHLLRAGNDLGTVRLWLDHSSIATTDLYTEIDDETKRRALEATDPLPRLRHRPSWKRGGDLLAWLERM